MRKLAVVLTVALLASPVMADRNRSEAPIFTATATPIGVPTPRAGALYDGVSGTGATYFPYSNFSGMSGIVGVDDYTTIAPNDPTMTSFQFVGGVATTSGVLFFTFFDSSAMTSVFDSFGVQLPTPGLFIWNITISTPFAIPQAGYLSMWADTGIFTVGGTDGLWLGNTSFASVVIGSNSPAFPVGGIPGATSSGAPVTDGVQIFAINGFIPEPATIALFGTGMFFILRRRR